MNTHSKTATAPRPRIKDKRTAILQAALKVFAEGGVNGVPMPVLAEQAGVGTGTIYRYFSSKEVLVNELFREEKLNLNKRLYANLDKSLTPKESFALVWERMVAYTREAPESYRFMELQDHRPYLDEQSRTMEHEAIAPILAYYRRLQEQGVYREDIRAEVLMALIWGAFVNLIRAERDGLFSLDQADINAARDACWSLCTG
ncbi:TetR/AcrR family transcriptional regulator [Halopseudomonas salina]|uniref:HTH-type transcriptional repressor FatR n=1 Tax=Halopseudomonas salina TaxID=1323744 RepID=A0ABQ1P799_9GAMM|nr:TetR/AcrR family transcriptional regulator [Halopseudomonas salina]GGC92596.1 HTH-type transcriptional repressor FatR [Halopseudomonas salina]